MKSTHTTLPSSPYLTKFYILGTLRSAFATLVPEGAEATKLRITDSGPVPTKILVIGTLLDSGRPH